MTDALLARVTSIIKPSTMAEIAAQFGVPEASAARGLALSAGTTFAALANKAGDPEAMRQVIDAASRTPADAIASGVSSGQVADPASSLMSTGRSFLSSVFGGTTNWAADLIGREAGLGAATAPIMALGAYVVMAFIGGLVRNEGLTASSLASFLRREAPGLRKTMPAAFGDAFTTHFADTGRTLDINPVVAQSVRKQGSWIPWLTAAAILVGGAWLWYGLQTPTMGPLPAVPAVGTSGTIATPAPETTTRFDSDRMLFDTGSAQLRPQSNGQLRAVAAFLTSHPDARATIGGYTDNVGSAPANLKLSEDRANSVKHALIDMGVDPDRLTAAGYGEAQPVGDNSTEAGRAMNRRISLLVTQK